MFLVDKSSFSAVTMHAGANHTPTMTMPIFLPDGSGRFVIPYFPGNSLRGRMRRAAGREIAHRIKPLTVGQYHFLTCGSVSASPAAGGTADLVKLQAARNDLYLGVFGGGPYLAKSGISVRMMVPICAQTLQGTGCGLVPSEYADMAVPVVRSNDLLTELTCVKKDDLTASTYAEVASLFTDYNEVALQYSEGVLKANAQRKDVKEQQAKQRAETKAAKAAGIVATPTERIADVKKTTIANMFSFDAVPAGTPFYFRLDAAAHLSPAQLYFAARSLAQTFSEPLGGWGRAGFGVMHPELVISRAGAASVPLFDYVGGRWEVAAGVFTPDEIAQFDEALGAVTAATIEQLLDAPTTEVELEAA